MFKSYMANMRSEKAETFYWGPKHSYETNFKIICLEGEVFHVNDTVLAAASVVFLQKIKSRTAVGGEHENVCRLEIKAKTVNDFLTIIYPDKRSSLFDNPPASNARVRVEALIPMADKHLNGGMLESIRHWICAHPKLSTLATYESTVSGWEWGDDVIRAVKKELEETVVDEFSYGKRKSSNEIQKEHLAAGKQNQENALLLSQLSRQTLARLILIK